MATSRHRIDPAYDRSNGAETRHALRLKLDHPIGAGQELAFNELKAMVDRGGIFDEYQTIALYQRHTRRLKNELKDHLNDGSDGHFQHRLDKLRIDFGSDSKIIIDTEKIVPFLRRRLLMAATEALAGVNDKTDLEIIRRVIDNFEIGASPQIIGFLGKYGDWGDRNRIINLEEVYTLDTSILTSSVSSMIPEKASALVAIARDRIADLLELGLSTLQRRAILRKSGRKEIQSLNDEIILEALSYNDDECRAILALKCCELLSRKRIEGLLDRYTKRDDHQFCNAIHWLDLGVSMSRDIARSVARQELALRS